MYEQPWSQLFLSCQRRFVSKRHIVTASLLSVARHVRRAGRASLNQNVSSKRQKGVRKGKSLAELIASGGYRADRHWRLVLEGSKPDGVSDHVWQEIVVQAKGHLRKRMGDERRRAEVLLAQTDLTPQEIAAYEQLLNDLPQPVGDPTDNYLAFVDSLRRRPDYERKLHVKVGVLNPKDRLRAFELSGRAPVEFETWADLEGAHPKGEGAPLVFKILRD